ncbi:hypothetical protein NQ315_012459 [Exocentrus adspersus]|uniref:Uncharacterized protein n=1 Tax=Exocentrus adspersus TaxID=1586481 RepID=A0AAV8VMW8_9CUCU|nr:hypothetical protein NQ315_012459 [Exocentrus adspersus]
MNASLVQIPSEAQTLGVRMADGLTNEARGPVDVEIEIAGHKTLLKVFLLPRLFERIIVGLDWMAQNEATLDIKNQCIYFGTTTRQAIYWPSKKTQRVSPAPIKLEEGQAPISLMPRYERVLNEFADVFEQVPDAQHHRQTMPLQLEETQLSPASHVNISQPKRKRGCRGKGGLVYALSALYGPQTQTQAAVNQVGVNPDVTLYDEICQAQRDSPEYSATRANWQRLHNGEEPAVQYHQRILRDEYVVDQGLIWHVKDGHKALAYWLRVIEKYHDSPEAGHPGRDETIRRQFEASSHRERSSTEVQCRSDTCKARTVKWKPHNQCEQVSSECYRVAQCRSSVVQCPVQQATAKHCKKVLIFWSRG